MGYAERYITVSGLKTRYLEAGKGPALILMHGASLGSSADVWALSMEPLATLGFRVIAYDDPGYGVSDDPPDLTVQHRVAFFVQLLKALGIRQAHVIAHSQAGGVAVIVALEQPELFAKLMIIGTGSLVAPLPGQGPDEYSEGAEHEPTLDEVKEELKVHVFNVEAVPSELIEGRLRMSTGPRFQSYLKRRTAPRTTTGDVQPPLWERVNELKMPFLMLYGRADTRNHVAERAERAKQSLPHLRIELMDRASHLLQWDRPDEFHKVAAGFLK